MKSKRNCLLSSILLLIILLTNTQVLAQNKHLTDSIMAKISNDVPDGWVLNKFSDSGFTLERKKLIPIGNYQTRLALDSLKFKFIFIIQNIKDSRHKYKNDFLSIVASIENKENLNYEIPPSLVYDNYGIVIFDNHPDIRAHLMDSTIETETVDDKEYFNVFISRDKRNIDQEISYVYNQVINSIAKPENVIDYIALLDKYQRDELVTETDVLFFWGSLRDINYTDWREY